MKRGLNPSRRLSARHLSLVLGLLAVVVIGLVACQPPSEPLPPPPTGPPSDVSLSAWAVATPDIDGVISRGEWIDASVADFTLSYCSETHDCTIYVKNDDTYLYLAAVVRDDEYSDPAELYYDYALFDFDNNNNDTIDVGEDGLSIRFDSAEYNDRHNPRGTSGWSRTDVSEQGTNDLLGAATHTNPAPNGAGDYTFEYRHPLDTNNNIHDFSVSAGNTVGFVFSFADGETDCQAANYFWPSAFPAEYGDIIIASEAYVKLLFVPLNWNGTQEEFESQVDAQVAFFTDTIPLNACPEEISITKLDVSTHDFDTFGCSSFNCGVGSIAPFVNGLGINTADYDIVVGLIEQSPCAPIAGCSNGVDTVWVETEFETVLAHEIGHIYGLEDEYCSNDAGSTDCRCNDGDEGGCGDTGGDGAATGDVNFLDAECVTGPSDCPPDGSDDCAGGPCCNITLNGTNRNCSTEDYGICCFGNRNAAGGRAIMSFADVEDFSPGARGFDNHSRAHFAAEPDLNCHSPEGELSGQLIDAQLWLSRDGKVEEARIILGYGRPTRYYQTGGAYELAVLSREGEPLWRQTLDIRFDYNGPVYLDVDYSDILYERFPLHYRIPHSQGMQELVLRLDGEVIFSEVLDFCNGNAVCDANETHLSCPRDCPSGAEDGVCVARDEGACDPDCAEGVDPDCEGECGNGVCNANENHRSCPRDCPSGGRDGFCDEVGDDRCDPDCRGEKDPDCASPCGDGECATCLNPDDPYACENNSNCPSDCQSGGEDYYCDGQEDGKCDPDCGDGEDPDC